MKREIKFTDMNYLDISRITPRFVRLWWLSKIINRFDDLIISPEQVHIFGMGGEHWDLYRGHMIYIKHSEGLKTMAEYEERSVFR